MKKSVLLPLLVIVLSAAILLGLSLGLNGLATKNAQAEHTKVMQTLLPGSSVFTKESYDGEDAIIRSVHKGETGFVIETATQGYAGEIVMLIGVSKDGEVTGLTIRHMSETPGLGWRALKDWKFLAQFLRTKGDVAISTGSDDAFSGATGDSTAAETYVDGISGATVTSKAVARCVNAAVAYVTGADVDSGATSWGG